MQDINFGNKFYLRWRKVIQLLTLLICGFTAQSQIHSRINMPDYDERKVHFGYLLGVNYANFKIRTNEAFLKQDSILAIYPEGKVGFEVGFIFNYRLGEFFDFRTLPKVAFYERSINYKFKPGTPTLVADFQASIIELPLLLKYKSERRINTRFYMIGGIKPTFEVGAKKRQNRSNLVATKVFNLQLEYGIGIDNYFQLFKFAPELRFSMGIIDIFKKQNNLISNPIQSIKPYNFSVIIQFE